MPTETSIFDYPAVGQIAVIRSRRYLVEELVRTAEGRDSTLVKMSCLDDDAQGQPLEVLWEKEVDGFVLQEESWKDIGTKGFDPPDLFRAYLNSLQWNCVTAADKEIFQSPFRAGIQIHPYQLEPLRKALRLPRVNLFIADDVGLGKTIEAGLIARELLLRKRVRTIVVATPPSVLLQWRDELEQRFGLTFEILDQAYITRVRQQRGYGVNPWKTHSRFLVSQRLLIDERYTASLRDALGDFLPASLLILDEAHNVAPASGSKYAIDSKITKAIRDIAPRFEHRLFLSATPHNGHPNSFSALLEILDPQRFCRGVPVRDAQSRKYRDEVMVRRLKEDLRQIEGGFPKRNVVQVDIDGLPDKCPELTLATLLDKYRSLRDERLTDDTKRTKATSSLLVIGLQKRLLSSIEAFAKTLAIHRKTVLRHWEAQKTGTAAPASSAQTSLLLEPAGQDDDIAELPEDQMAALEDAEAEGLTNESIGKLTGKSVEKIFAAELKLLDEMAAIADDARSKPDARVRHLLDWVRKEMCPKLPTKIDVPPPKNATWNDARVIIFTESEDTKRYLFQQLSPYVEMTDKGDQRIGLYHGPTPPQKREELKRAFNADPVRHPIRILIATDAAREGINLQRHCNQLFHFDVPWNPSRLEQRNGRIDRKLQPASEVFCHYFVYKQRPEDRVLKVLVQKTERIKQELGSLSPVVEARLKKSLEGTGIRRSKIDEIAKELSAEDIDAATKKTVEEEFEETRQRKDALKNQIEELSRVLEHSKNWLSFEQDSFKHAISCSLQIAGADPLAPCRHPYTHKEGACFALPSAERLSTDPSWAATLDSLREPRKQGQKLWEWRESAPIRPVVFADGGELDDDVVHIHLEHRVTQRLLSRFSAQGFIHHDLSRACFTQSADKSPKVLLLGRLALYGQGAARLHEELITVGAEWVLPTKRKGKLEVLASEETKEVLETLKTGAKIKRQPTKQVLSDLQRSAATDIQELLKHLETQAKKTVLRTKRELEKRGEEESKSMIAILLSQKKNIEKTAHDSRQLELNLEDEKRQLEANKKYWATRLRAIDKELETEPIRIRENYNVVAERLEPIGLVYLWPQEN